MPRLPATPGPCWHLPFYRGQQDPPSAHPRLAVPQPGYRPWLGVLRRGWWGHPPGDPLSPLRAFFWSLRVSEDFFLISWRARLYSGGAEGLSEGTPVQQPPCMDPSCPPRTFRMVLVQLIGSFLPVLNPVLQRVYQALHEGTGAGREKQSVGECWSHGGSIPHPCPASTQHPLPREGGSLARPCHQGRGFGAAPGPAYLVNCRSLASMLRCRMHMRVSAEPMSLVAPGGSKVLLTRGRDTPTPVPAPFVRGEQAGS